MKRFLWLFMGAVGSHQAIANDGKYTINLGIGLANEQSLSLPSDTELSDEFASYFELGIGKEYVLSPSWNLATGLNLTYSEGDIDLATDTSNAFIASEVKNIGIWVDSTVKYTALFDNARPFLRVGIGQVYGEFSGPDGDVDDWNSGYRVTTGFEFDLGKKSSFSIGIGTGDVGSID
jgi:hypothetical protein